MEVKTATKDLSASLEELLSQLPDKGQMEPLKGFLGKLRGFLGKLEILDQGTVEEVIDSLEQDNDVPLFSEVGHLLRRFHDQMNSIKNGLPSALSKLHPEEVGGFTDKLHHILEMTDRAANKTMDLAEEGLDVLSAEKTHLETAQTNLDTLSKDSSLSAEAQAQVAAALEAVNATLANNPVQSNRMSEVLMAQDYQDLTGQLIHKVINLLKTIEGDMIDLIRRFAPEQGAAEVADVRTEGPMHETNEERNDQDDVDSLLSQFGF